jgi:hypothetical protein
VSLSGQRCFECDRTTWKMLTLVNIHKYVHHSCKTRRGLSVRKPMQPVRRILNTPLVKDVVMLSRPLP